MSNVSSHASRVWITSGERRARGRARSAPRTRRAARRAASGRSGSRGRTHRSRRRRVHRAAARSCRRLASRRGDASPTVAHTPSCAAAMSIAIRLRVASVPMVIMRSTPAARAAAIAPSAARHPFVVEMAVVVGPGHVTTMPARRCAGTAASPSRPAGRPGTRPTPTASAAAGRAPNPGARCAARSPGSCRDRRAREHRDDAQHLERVAEHTIDRGAGLGLPWLGRLELGVHRADEPPRGLERLGRLHALPRVRGMVEREDSGVRERAVGPRRRPDAAALLADHRATRREQVAEVVREVGVVARDHPLVGEVVVGTERHVGEEVVPIAVDAEVGDELGRRDLVELRLAHLLAGDEQPAVHMDRRGRLEPGRQQHRRPVHAVEAQDVLADEVMDRATTS